MNVSSLLSNMFPVNLHDLMCYILCFLLEFQNDDSQRLLESLNADKKEHRLMRSKAEPYTSTEEMVLEVKLCSCRWMSILLHVAMSMFRACSKLSLILVGLERGFRKCSEEV